MKEQQLIEILEQMGSQEFNGSGTNKRVERFIRERELSMSKKQRITIVSIVLGSSLVCAGLAAAVTNQIVSQRFQFVTDSGEVFEGEIITPMGPGATSGTFVTSDGSVYEFDMDTDETESETKSSESVTGD
ncbi:MAG: hypothetical protein ED559_05500 [Phycisphaera sp.]|nr:MAG: hypothetical protein ED559_05500 [Phycisphaera sp.]